MLARLRRFVASSPIAILLAAFVVAAVGGLAITAIVLSQGGSKKAAARVVDFGPTGDSVDPLGGLSLKLDGSIDRKRLESGLKITPPVQGTVSWNGAGFTFKPKWPGFAPGASYQVDLSDGKRRLTQWSFKTSGDLAVQFTNPGSDDSEVDPQAVVIVQFNRPVAAVTALQQQQTQNVLVFDPPVTGTGSWVTSATFRFQPATGFAPSTSYSVRVPHDLTGLPGGTLPQDYAFGFKTVLPAVGDEFPRDNTQFVDPAADVRVLFNQPVDRASAEASLKLTAAGGSSVAGNVTWPDDQTLVFHPLTPWPRGSGLTASVAQGIKSRGGAGTSARPFSWSFTVAPNPAVAKTDPANGATNGGTFGINVTFNTAMDHDSTEAAVSIEPAPDKANPPTLYWGQDTQLFINFPLQPSSPYRVTIGAGAKDRYGQALAEPYSLSFTTAARQPALSILSGTFAASQGTLDAGSPPIVSIATTNVPQASLTLSSVSAADFRILGGNGPQRDNYNPAASSVLRSWTLPLPNQQLNQTLVTQIDLNQGLSRGPLQPGFYLLDATAPSLRRTRIALELTRTSVVVKRGIDSAFVWAADLSNGAPASGAQVTLLDSDGNRIGAGATADDGTFAATIPVPGPNSGTRPVFALVERSGDSAMASDGWTGSATPFGFGFPVIVTVGTGLRGYVYTDRPIYRTGETAHVRVVLRADADGSYSLPQDTSTVSLDVQDSRGHAVASFPVKLDEYGSMGADVQIPTDGATGAYSLNLTKTVPAPPSTAAPPPPSPSSSGSQSAPPNTIKQFITSGSFLVAEFRAPEFQVDVKTDKPAYTNGDTLKADLQADLFFGSPLAGAAIAWTVNASPYAFHPDDAAYAGFSFSDPGLVNAQRPAPKPVANSTGTTDSSGHATLNVPAQLGDFPTSETFTISGTVTDTNQQQVSASASAIVHKAAVYAGAKPQKYVISAGDAAGFDLVTLDTAAKPAGSVAVKVEAYQRTWTTVKKRDADGSEQYVSTPNDTLVDSHDVTTDGQGKGSYQFTPAKGGQYRIVVSGRDGAGNQFRAAASVYVSASDLLSWQVDNNDRIQLVADKAEYAPGETAHVLVPAPFAGTSALVTVERGHVLSHDVRQFATNSTVVDVPITDSMAPTVYLSVALIKPAAGADTVAAYRLGYVQLKVSPATHQLNVALKPDKTKFGPGDTVNVAVSTKDSTGKGVAAEVSLAVVDQAILSLADDRNGAIFDSFYSDRALGIETGATLGVSLNVANQAFATAAGGGKGGSGGGDDGSSQNVRSTFQNTAFWQADVKTDASGNATVAVKLPDNLTTWRINARGVTSNTIAGETGTSIVTSRDLIVRPVAPRFFTAGDAARLGAIVNNQTDSAMDVSVSLAAQGVDVKGGAQKLKVPARGSATAYWDTTAGDAGSATVTWQAKADGGLSDGAQLALPVHDRSTPETVASAGIVTSSDAQERVVLPDYARTDKGQIALQLDPSLSAVLKLAAGYLESWPYEPADVTAGRVLDRIANWQAAVKLQRPQQEQADDRDAAVRGVARLIGSQSPDGGWAWWLGGKSSPQVTAQVVHALGMARVAGLTVDKNVLNQATKYLTDYYNQPTDALHPADPDGRAFILLALAAAGTGSDKRDGALADQRKVLGGSGKGALLEALLLDGASKSDPTVRALADDLISSAVTSATGTHWEDGGTSATSGTNSTRATSLAASALLRLDPQQPLLDGAMRWLAATRQDGHWRSPNETSLAVSAIGTFVAAREVPVAGLTYAVTVNGKQAGAGDFQQAGPQGTADVKVPLAGLPVGAQLPVDITKQGSGQLYYGLFMTYYTPAQGVSALSNGVTVSREYLPADGETPVSQVKNGDLVRVRITIVAPADLQQLRVEDYLPAGLEAVDGSLKITDQNLLQRQADDQRRLLQQPQPAGQAPKLKLNTDRDRRLINPFEHVEVLDDHVALFASAITRGVHEYVYYARATTAGTFSAPPVTATESQYPDVFGRGDSGTLTVTP